VDEARLWLLLETIGQAAVGLKRELALEPSMMLPGDYVADTAADRPGGGRAGGARALDADDPARLDQLLALPKAHLMVDGYNVTKKGYGEISLEQQRGRLVNAMAGLAAQTGAEVTVVFDGAEKVWGCPPRRAGCGCCSAARARPRTSSSASSSGPNPPAGRSSWSRRIGRWPTASAATAPTR
jgi:hypothetical protein